MTVLDIIKIVVPIILALCGAVFVMMRWAMDKQAASTESMWEAINKSLLDNIGQLAKNLESHKGNVHQRLNGLENRFGNLQAEVSSHKKEVAEFYIKRQDWLDHALSLERKVDELRRDVHHELQGITRLVTEISKKADH